MNFPLSELKFGNKVGGGGGGGGSPIFFKEKKDLVHAVLSIYLWFKGGGK